MVGKEDQQCPNCESGVVFTKCDDDGFFYCGFCYTRAEDIIYTGADDEQSSIYSTRFSRVVPRANAIATDAEPISQVRRSTSQYLDDHNNSADDGMENVVGDGVGPTEPSDFGSSQENISDEECCSKFRSIYLKGLQFTIQLQCRTLVDKFNVSPLIIGLVGPLWLRFVASTKITSDEWTEQAFLDSVAQIQGELDDSHGKRVVYIWYRSLKSKIPISCSLAITFLVCHLAREPITPSDILNWTIEGNLPYFTAFVEIKKKLGARSKACPIHISRMFRPIQAISSQKLESMAADIAREIRLMLPPVNFHAIASRYFRQLSLPIGKLLPLTCSVCEWSTPPVLYLSANELKIPTRACVMSIVIVTIRLLYGINGYGVWESNLSENEDAECLSHVNMTEDVVELLKILEAKYSELDDMHAYSSDLASYLKYCKDVVFSGLPPLKEQPSKEDIEEKKLLEELWDFYQNNKVAETSDDQSVGSVRLKNKRCRQSKQEEDKTSSQRRRDTSGSKYSKFRDDYSYSHQDSARENRPSKDKAIKLLKLDMEENKFCYIPPRTKVKRKDYVHYARRRGDVYIYAVHADYYILLRSCAKVAQFETRIMHIAVLSLERRLQWLEKRSILRRV